MKKKIQEILSCMVVLCLTVGGLIALTNLMERKDSDRKYGDFWKQEEFDVLFLGSSHVINGVAPMELWKDYGIMSYNLGGHGNFMGTTYWVMKNALEHTVPKVMVIDCAFVGEMRKSSSDFSYLHLSLDTFPFSKTKVDAVMDLLDDPNTETYLEENPAAGGTEQRTRLGLLWDFSVYHSRWTDLNWYDLHPVMNCEKGAESRINLATGIMNKIPSDEKPPSGRVGETYLRKMIEECQERGIQVVLTYLPFPAGERWQKEANFVEDLAQEYGVPYLNFLNMDLVSFETDLYDSNSHLNPSGARKVTSYLGDFLCSQFHLPDRRLDDDYTFWNADYIRYQDKKNEDLRKQSDLALYLMLLAGDDLEIRMDVRNKNILGDSQIRELLYNLGIGSEELTDDTDFILIRNRGMDAMVLHDLREDGASRQTGEGQLKMIYEEEEKACYHLYLDEQLLLTGNAAEDGDIRIEVYRDDQKIDSVQFLCYCNPQAAKVSTMSVNRQ